MARRRKPRGATGATPLWLITFSDLMTLLLTFFVLMVSMAVIDERTKREVLGSVSEHFGISIGVAGPAADGGTPDAGRDPGRAEELPKDDLDPLRDMVFDEREKELEFKDNRYVQILSINADVLFERGGYTLSPRGRELMGKIVPYLQRVEYPVLVAGHTSVRREEEGNAYAPDFDETKADPSWMLSFRRSNAVYRFCLERGVPVGRMTLEGFGRFHPRFSNETPEGREKNRRVDLVLDKRNMAWIRKVDELREKMPEIPKNYYYHGFSFDLTMPGENREPQ